MLIHVTVTRTHRSIDCYRLMLRNKVIIAMETEIQNSPANYKVSDENDKDRRELSKYVNTRASTRALHSSIPRDRGGAGPGVDLGHKVGGPGLGADGSAAHWSRDQQPPRARAVCRDHKPRSCSLTYDLGAGRQLVGVRKILRAEQVPLLQVGELDGSADGLPPQHHVLPRVSPGQLLPEDLAPLFALGASFEVTNQDDVMGDSDMFRDQGWAAALANL